MQRIIATLTLISATAMLAFGLLGMSLMMHLPSHFCPVAAAQVSFCPGASMAATDHHVGGWQDLATFTLASAVFGLAVIFLVWSRAREIVPNAFMREQHERSLTRGPPSPVAVEYFWSALHNKFGDIAPARA